VFSDETKISNLATTPQPTLNITAQPNVDCYTGFGTDYRGRISVTADGTPCMDWSKMKYSYGKSNAF